MGWCKQIICSTDARKVIKNNQYLIDHIFAVEKSLYMSYPHILNQLLKKYNGDFEKVFAMINRGYVRNVKRDDLNIMWDKIIFHYYYLTEKYLDNDFPYADIVALNDISMFKYCIIDKYINTIKVKNMWYLRKILVDESVSMFNDISLYKHICDINVHDIKNKGKKIDVFNLKEYVE